jgi:hypothetical protein
MKYAIRITDGQTTRLFAVVKDDVRYVEWLRYEAKKTFTYGSSEWLTVSEWAPEFDNVTYAL